MRNIVLCILYLFLVPMGGFAQSEVVVLYPDTENKDLVKLYTKKSFWPARSIWGKAWIGRRLPATGSGRFRRDGISCSILVEIKG